jgi:hypothetical protein
MSSALRPTKDRGNTRTVPSATRRRFASPRFSDGLTVTSWLLSLGRFDRSPSLWRHRRLGVWNCSPTNAMTLPLACRWSATQIANADKSNNNGTVDGSACIPKTAAVRSFSVVMQSAIVQTCLANARNCEDCASYTRFTGSAFSTIKHYRHMRPRRRIWRPNTFRRGQSRH